MSKRLISWFSCGAASAVATKLAIQDFGADAVEVIRQDTGSEHPDNERFMQDCEEWFGKKVRVVRSEKYASTWEVFEARKYLAGVAGAPCTSELKRIPAEKCIDFGVNQQTEIFGYTAEERERFGKWMENNNERIAVAPLIERGLTKDDCIGMIDRAGIEIPEMYKLGYRNNNCIGCVKGGAGYWNHIRQDFPDEFNRMSKLERKFNAAINKKYEGEDRVRVFLDELPEDMGDFATEASISCGLFCMAESETLGAEQ